jgi:hypothetical protein
MKILPKNLAQSEILENRRTYLKRRHVKIDRLAMKHTITVVSSGYAAR